MRRIAIIFTLALMVTAGAWAQAGAGSAAVTGRVMELAGDGIPDTTVTLSNPSLGFRRVMNTSDDGVFDAPSLVPSAGYQIKITRKGFVEWDSGTFTLALGQTMNFRVTLKHTAGYQGDESNIPKPQIQETQNGQGTLVGQRQVENLPSTVLRVDPLVQSDPLAGIDHRTGEAMLAGRTNNLFVMDGVDTTNTYYPSQPALGNLLSLEATQEFQVLSENYLAPFGPSSGGVINAVTHHGSNDFHGSAYDYFANSSLAASDKFGLGQKLFGHQNQAGATAGGPVIHNRIFFFGNVEVLDGTGQGLNRITSPLLSSDGQTIDPSNCHSPATPAQCTAAIRFLQSQMNTAVPLTENWVNALGKVDYRRSERNNFTGSFDFLNAKAPNGGNVFDQIAASGGLLGLQNTSNDVRYGKAAWTSAPTRSTLNEMRLGYLDDKISEPPFTPGLSTGNIGVIVEGVTAGNPHPNTSSIEEQRYQITDNFTLTSNTHSLTLGGEFWRNHDIVNELNPAQYTYDSLTAFAQDLGGGGKDYTLFNQQVGAALRTLPLNQYNAWAFDVWRPAPRLTIVAGVRFEKPIIPQPAKANSSYYETGIITSPNINFAPRVSIAYQADDKTVLRAGYGWFYEPMPGSLFDALYYVGNAINLADVTAVPNQTNAPAFPKAYTTVSSIPSGMTDLVYGTNKLRNPDVRELTISMERRLTSSTTLTVNVLHNRGYRLYSVSDPNIKAPDASGTNISRIYTIDNAAGQAVNYYYTDIFTLKNDPKYEHLWEVQNGSSWWYNAAVLEIRQRMARGLTMQASYTLSSALGDNASPMIFGALPLATYNGNVGGDRGVMPMNQRQRGEIAWTWTPERRWLKGWALSGITTLASGQTETPQVMVEGQQFSGTTYTLLYANSLDGWGGWNRVPFENIGSLNLGPQYNLDVRLSRSFTIRERYHAVLMFDAFNALNNQFNTAINTYAYTAIPTTPPNGAVNGPFSGVLHPVAGVGTGIAGAPARMAQIALRFTF